ncbi:hypothetical protein Pint_25297 [Pistacia integerrima]|uniref:Uncharacterized protein n=2 Tax=Pistacia TaxID=55512 RepID=A0ACC1B2Q5_9ROSI|nr:hypothetical protein Pint_25297 [Pistacia integerrima]KAJ0093219.1 hypothetical protein Patl1_25866 [Pistacia atlantica]
MQSESYDYEDPPRELGFFAQSVNKMTEEITDKAKDFVSDATKATGEAIKEKIKDK